MNVLAIITARKNSKRLPNKNMLKLGNKPLVSWTIDFAKKINIFENILMTTDDPNIVNISKKKNILAPWIRPKSLSKDKTSSFATVAHALKWYEKNYGKVDSVCLLQPTSPFRSKKNLLEAFKFFKKNNKSVLSVGHIKVKNPFNVKYLKNKFYNIYIPTGSFFFITPKELYKYKNFINKNNNIFLVRNKKENIDVNNIRDWNIAKRYIG